MKKIFSLLLVTALCLSLLTACNSNSGVVSELPADKTSTTPEEPVESTGTEIEYPIEVESDITTAVIEDEVEAIAVFELGMLDILDTLGFGDRVVAVTHGMAFPDYLSQYAGDQYISLGGFKDANLDALSESNPDLIFGGFRENETLNEIAPTIYFMEASGDGSALEVLERRVNAITTIFGEAEEAAEYLNEIYEKVAKIKEYTSENEVSFISVIVENGGLSMDGVSGNAFLTNDLGLVSLYESTIMGGKGSGGRGGDIGELDDIDELEGERGGRGGELEDLDDLEGGRGEGGRGEGEDASAQTAEAVTYITEKNPTYIFVLDKDASEVEEGQPTAQEVMESVDLAGTDAYENGNIIYLDYTVWYCATGGLRSTIRQLDSLIELFGIE